MEKLYLVYGKNRVRIDETVNKLTKDYLATVDDFNRIVFDYIETEIEHIIEECITLPFLSDRKVVIVKDAFLFTAEKKRTSIDHNIDKMIQYIEDKEDDTLLIFVTSAEKLDNRKKITKLIKKQGKIIECEEMNERELVQHINDAVKSEGLTIRNDAVNELLNRTGANYTIVKNELEKLMLFAHDIITVEDVNIIVSKSLEANVFSLTDFILKNQKREAVDVFRDLILQKEEPIKLLGLISSQFRLYYQTKILMNEGMRQDEISSRLKVHPYRVKLAMSQVNQYPLEVLLQKMVLIRDMDYELKSTYLDSEALFEVFISKI
ncbi:MULTISPECIES: DNA polymerase III subunit delta [Nosocomiicoccus]|uniref:DNA polymerase III subunit delta n=1 Tax=Nosocomiicoccus massiliensis TaxID=1232430 RepID=A0AAF1BVK6_9STAP|nr:MULTISPECIES: DNA polymerase III subunit delta [Nosocomiicoccus]OFS64136.1 DNA polymerase III subunit delta [Nosocomiicoccus sp. HMSC09A07]WOS96426.1 DNA polymerase III subunit delta [Nosocomiicoccus massiliensis]